MGLGSHSDVVVSALTLMTGFAEAIFVRVFDIGTGHSAIDPGHPDSNRNRHAPAQGVVVSRYRNRTTYTRVFDSAILEIAAASPESV